MMRRYIWLGLGTMLLGAVLLLPNHPGTMEIGSFTKFPLELPFLIGAMIALGQNKWLSAALALLLTATVVLKLADYGMFVAYNRHFNPILDTYLIAAGAGLLRDTIGATQAVLAAGAAVLGMVAVFLMIYQALHAWARIGGPVALRYASGGVALVFLSVTVVDAGHGLKYWTLEHNPAGTSWTTRMTFKRAVEMSETAEDLAAFRVAAREDAHAHRSGLFDMIGERDVLFIFIESYGRASFDNPLYSDLHVPTLRAAEPALDAAGFDMRSGWLTSPTTGGQSWLAHGALATGLWTSDAGRYSAMLTSGRRSLFHLAQNSGYRTAAIMPAITMPWPESALMGFDDVFPAKDLPYKGERFNWVTMPDQFTLSAYPDLLGEDPKPDFLQIALISSHAPWVPIPPVIPWDEVGDGSIFTQWATQGPSPQEVWKDRDRVRTQYRKAIDYALQVTLEHVVRLGPEAPLVFVIGDHQAASFVAQSENADVAIHAIGPADVLDHIATWGWQDGLVPDASTPVWRMDHFRNRFIETFSSQHIAKVDG